MRRVLLAESAVVARLLALRHRRLAHRVELFLRLLGVVRAAGRDHLFADFAVAPPALRLLDRTFVVVETEPPLPSPHRGYGFLLAAPGAVVRSKRTRVRKRGARHIISGCVPSLYKIHN